MAKKTNRRNTRNTKTVPRPTRRAVSKRLVRTTPSKPSPVRAREEEDSKLPTKSEMKALRAFAKLTEEGGKTPSVREVSREMGLSELGAQPHLQSLARKGCIEELKELKVVDRKLTPLGKQWLKLPS